MLNVPPKCTNFTGCPSQLLKVPPKYTDFTECPSQLLYVPPNHAECPSLRDSGVGSSDWLYNMFLHWNEIYDMYGVHGLYNMFLHWNEIYDMYGVHWLYNICGIAKYLPVNAVE